MRQKTNLQINVQVLYAHVSEECGMTSRVSQLLCTYAKQSAWHTVKSVLLQQSCDIKISRYSYLNNKTARYTDNGTWLHGLCLAGSCISPVSSYINPFLSLSSFLIYILVTRMLTSTRRASKNAIKRKKSLLYLNKKTWIKITKIFYKYNSKKIKK